MPDAGAAFLGLGAIGRPMAARLARRGPLVVWNRTGARAREFAEAESCRAAVTPREAAQGASTIVTCLPTSADVENLLDGPDGLLAGLTKGSLFIDCTSGDPIASGRIATRLANHGVTFVDAPVSGGTNGAEAGTLTVMVGGDPAAFSRALPVLQAFGSRIEHIGPVGTGHALKAVNNALLAVNILAAGEGLIGLVRGGVPARKALEVLNASSGRSFVTESLVPDRVLTGRYPNTFRLALLDKDVRIAVDFLAAQGVEAPILGLASRLLAEIRRAVGEDADYLEAIRFQEQRAGAEIRG